jgi:Na+/phosphate symporter
LAQALKDADISPSKETSALLEGLFQKVQESAHSALRALVIRDERAAQAVVASRASILELASDLHRQQAARLAQDDPDRLLKHRVQLEILDKLQRIYSVAEHMAISVLPRSALAGALAV